MAISVLDLRLCAAENGGADKPSSPGNGQAPKQSGAGGIYVMIVMVAIGVGLGIWLDKHFGTKPWWTLGSSMFFLIAGFYLLISESRR